MRKGKVYIVGAGPGDWELITIKGLKRIKEADVILYDFLASKDLLRFAKKNAEIICAGKSDGLHLIEQGRINKLLFEKAKNGKVVVRLKGGDPLVFSRGIEEVIYLRKKKIDHEIIEGITSAFAAPESFGIPLTRRGRFDSIAVLTGHKSSGKALDAPKCDTLIYLMAVGEIKKVVKTLLDAGRNKKTSCAFIEKGTTDQQRIVFGTLSDIAKKAQEFCVKPPAVLIVGDIVGYAKRIYGNKPKD